MEFDAATLFVSGSLLGLGAIVASLLTSIWSQHTQRQNVKNRLLIDDGDAQKKRVKEKSNAETTAIRREKKAMAERTSKLVSAGNAAQTKLLRQRLIQAGFVDKNAVSVFLLARLIGLGVFAPLPLLFNLYAPGVLQGIVLILVIVVAAGIGYKLPDFVVNRRIANNVEEARTGFPDFLDLMTVCANAGLSMEASLSRVSTDLKPVYPNLSENLVVVCSEMRAGLGIEEALINLSQRIPLEDIRPFASLLRQSKELGTSLSAGLKVYSEDMRHKRLSLAEEKAHALPAKLSIPVTVCILPIVVMVAVLPAIIQVLKLD